MPQKEPENEKHQWWRWPLVLIVPPIAALIIGFVFHWGQWFSMKVFGGYSEDGWMVLYIAPLCTAGFCGWSYARIAAFIAPSAKFVAAVIMSLLLGGLGVFASIVAIVGERYPAFEAVSVSLMSAAAICGLVYGLFQIKIKSNVD